MNIAVLASGRGSNFEALARARQRGDLTAPIRVLVSDVPDAPVLETARRFDIEALHLPPGKFRTKLSRSAEERYVAELKARDIELVCLAGFMRILHDVFLENFTVMNIHPSLLPAFPGLDVQQKALDYGVKFSGCTVHFVDAGIDTGPIIKQAVVPVLDEDTADTLAARILEQEHQIYWQAVELWHQGQLQRVGRRVIRKAV